MDINVALVALLLSDLQDALRRRDGDAALHTISLIRIVAGDAFADRLVIELITAGIRRMAGQRH